MVRVKICGITNVKDARLAARLGADALGFNFYSRSPRFVQKARARAIIAALPPFVTCVGVFVDEDPAEVVATCAYCGIDTAQLHGDEPPASLGELKSLRRIKAIRVRSERDLDQMGRYEADAFLLDAWSPDAPGGTGQTFEWELVRRAAPAGPIILAGGLTPENVAQAVRVARPYAVDVASGVESEPGAKDRDLLAAFIANAKGCADPWTAR